MEGSELIKQKDKFDINNNEKPRVETRARSKSLFEAEKPNLAETDRGVFVMSHADFPRKQRTHSNPTNPEKVNPNYVKPLILHEGKIKKIIHDIFENALSSKLYNYKECSSVVKDLVAQIKDKVSELQIPNHKLACTCLITKRNTPSPFIESGCIWDSHKTSDERDAFVEFLYKSDEFYALGTVYGVYDEKFEKTASTSTTTKSNSSGGRPSPIPE